MVQVNGQAMQRNSQVQVEVSSLTVLAGPEADEVRARIEEALERRAEPAEIPLLVESDVMTLLRPQMREVAKAIRKAVFVSQPILLRHHADADGICSAVAIEQAVVSLIHESGGDFDADYFLFKARRRRPRSTYEIEDINRGLDFATKDLADRPEDAPRPADRQQFDRGRAGHENKARVFGLKLIVVDHHHPDALIDQYSWPTSARTHVGGICRITAGMRDRDRPSVRPPSGTRSGTCRPVAAVGEPVRPQGGSGSGLSTDRYSEDECKAMALALDFEAVLAPVQRQARDRQDPGPRPRPRSGTRSSSGLLVEGANQVIADWLESDHAPRAGARARERCPSLPVGDGDPRPQVHVPPREDLRARSTTGSQSQPRGRRGHDRLRPRRAVLRSRGV